MGGGVLYCICKDHRNEIKAPHSVVKDLISYKTRNTCLAEPREARGGCTAGRNFGGVSIWV